MMKYGESGSSDEDGSGSGSDDETKEEEEEECQVLAAKAGGEAGAGECSAHPEGGRSTGYLK
jgi:hypothetical protein